jgi:hypothetical protein
VSGVSTHSAMGTVDPLMGVSVTWHALAAPVVDATNKVDGIRTSPNGAVKLEVGGSKGTA